MREASPELLCDGACTSDRGANVQGSHAAVGGDVSFVQEQRDEVFVR